MKTFIIKSLFFSAFPIILLIGVNYKYDPANLFDSGNKYERTIAEYLHKGYNVTNISNMDERMLQKFFIEGMLQCPDIVVFGSSNSLDIDSDFFPNKRFTNNFVSASSLNDFLAIYDLYERKGFKPQKAIFGLCPEMFNNMESEFWISLQDNYYSMMSKIGLPATRKTDLTNRRVFDRWAELLSLSYFQQAAQRAFNNSVIEPTTEKVNKGATRIIDGSLNSGNMYTQKSREQINNTVKRLLNKPAPEIEGLGKLNPDKTEKLEHFVDYLQKQDVEVIFYLMVYHPIYYPYVSSKYTILKEIQDYLISIAVKKKITIIGQNNPSNCGVTIDDFNDYNHLNKKGLKIIFSNPHKANELLNAY